MTSPELTGGAGFTFEDAVAAFYLAALVNGTTAVGLTSRVVQRVALQQASFGEPLDDVIVDATGLADNSTMRLSLQVKRSLTISDATSNTDFREVVQHSWQTLQKPDFREYVDRVGAVVGTVSDDAFRNFTTVCEWARSSQTPASFLQRFRDGGNASAAHRGVIDAVRNIAQDPSAGSLSDENLYRLFSHLILIRFDFLHEGSTSEAEVLAGLQRALMSSQAGRAAELWRQLRQLVRDGAGRSAEFTRASVLRQLTGGVRFVGTPALAGDLQVLQEGTRHWLAQQADDIGGTHLDRAGLRAKLATEMAGHRLTIIKGLPGTGKTVLLRDLLAGHVADGSTLLLTANRLSGRSWTEYARKIGLSTLAVEPILVEIGATGHAVLFIDGLDRIAPEQRPVVTDVLGQILSIPALANLRIVATARDAGIEPLRNWVPPALLSGGGVGYVDVENLTDEEASTLARTLPALRPLLMGGDERVRALARRPFFAAVLARGFAKATYPAEFAPRSEVDLVDAWWSRGGYDAQAPQTLARQRALIELAQHSAPDLGRNVRIRDLTPATQGALPALEEDGLMQQVRQGHTAQFSHDIFFEWSFYHLLLDQGEEWIKALTDAGEPPALARVVELMSQATYVDSAQWTHSLKALQDALVRPQWLRAWLIAPPFSPDFNEHAEMYASTLSADNHGLFGKLLVWMQAEKTTPNPMVLSGRLGADDLQASARIRLADALGWPSDFAAWGRLLHWTLDQIAAVPDQYLPDLVTLFETWQMAVADIANPVSDRIVRQCATWLHAIEDENQSRRWRHRLDDAAAQVRERVPSNLETELRGLVLRAARAYPDVVGAYLTKLETIERLSDSAFREVVGYTPLLAQTHPVLLAQVARRTLMEELPDDTVERWRNEAREQGRRRAEVMEIPEDQRTRWDELALTSPMIPNSFSHHDWDRLSIGADHRGYFPASPLREPFHSLLIREPAVGLALIRDMANHATTAWRQLHHHMRGDGTPLPLSLEFPWGCQEFWGDTHQYQWFRGHGGPQALECALMALERWALEQLDAGHSAAEVLQQLMEGHSSIAILGIAAHVALRTKEVSAVTLALVGSQRLWHYDIQRYVQESQLRSAGLIGFNQDSAETAHRKAVADTGALESRRLELRSLVPLFVLGRDQQLRVACREALERFSTELQFDYEEEAQDEGRVAELRRTAELWSEWGRAENYAATPVPGRDDVIGIELRSPRHSAPEVQEALQRHAQVSRETELWLWVNNCFESRKWARGFSPGEVVERAKSLSLAVTVGQAASLLPGNGIAHGAIAGTAAAIYCFSEAHEHEAWADATIKAYRDELDVPADDVFSGSIIPWQPKIFVAHALAARIRSGCANSTDRLDLYQLVAHPLELVSLTAIEGVASCWGQDQRFAWCGFDLGLRLAQYRRTQDSYTLSAEARRRVEESHRNDILTEARREYEAGGDLPAWVRPHPSWTQDQSRTRRHHSADEDDGWHRSDDIWISGYAAKVLRQIPVADVMGSAARSQYVDALEAFVEWTLDTLNPTWRTERRSGRERDGADLYEWQDELGRSLARVAPHLSTAEMRERLIDPILDQPDEIAMQLLQPFATSIVCSDILDSLVIEDDILELLQVVLERTLQHRDLRRSGYNDGRISGFDLPELIKSLLFVVVERADMAERFANGQWGDLPRVMPLVDKMVRQAGWNPYVARQFVTLCERAGADYPADVFSDQVLAQMEDESLPSGWKGTSIPASIAGLVQAHADRLHPLPIELAQKLLHVLDALVDLGDRRSAALQLSESFRGVRLLRSG